MISLAALYRRGPGRAAHWTVTFRQLNEHSAACRAIADQDLARVSPLIHRHVISDGTYGLRMRNVPPPTSRLIKMAC